MKKQNYYKSNNIEKSNVNKAIKDIVILLIGCFIYSISTVLFIDPVQVIPGSVTGIAIVTKALFNIPIGILSICINIPLFLLGYHKLGGKFLVYTILTVVSTSVMIDSMAGLTPFTEDVLLASVFGGVIMGIGLGLILKVGGSTGGTTIIGRLVLLLKPDLPIGNILLVGDFIIILIGSILLKDNDKFLYSLINLYICVVVINKINKNTRY